MQEMHVNNAEVPIKYEKWSSEYSCHDLKGMIGYLDLFAKLPKSIPTPKKSRQHELAKVISKSL